MKIGVFSDMHDRTDHLEPAMRQMRLLDCGHFMFLGDCTTPESFQRLIELTGGLPLDAVPGNNDYELAIMRQLAACSPATRLHPEHVLLTRYGMKFSLSHYPKYAMQEARSGNVDAALYGNTHQAARVPAGQSGGTPGQDRPHRLRHSGHGFPHHEPAFSGFQRMMNILDVCCALIELPCAQGTLLLGAKKKAGQSNGLLYEFPGGKVEPGENARDAIIREIREELGCAVHPVRMLTPVRHRERERIIRLIPFLCRLEPCALPRPLEHESLGFFSGRMLEKLPWAPADLPVLRQWMEENR